LPGNEIRQIIDDDSAEVNSSSSDFWILVAALKVSIIIVIQMYLMSTYGIAMGH
jgi:hypothetical protein